MQQWFEFAPIPIRQHDCVRQRCPGATLIPYTTTGGVKKVARYRYNYQIRRTPDSTNDFTNIFR